MARVLGEAGRYVGQEAGKKQQRMLAVAFFGMGLMSWFSGFCFDTVFHKRPWWQSLLVNAIILAVIVGLWRLANHQIDKLDKQRMDMRRAEDGEIAFASKLHKFPDDFFIVHGLSQSDPQQVSAGVHAKVPKHQRDPKRSMPRVSHCRCEDANPPNISKRDRAFAVVAPARSASFFSARTLFVSAGTDFVTQYISA